MRDEFKVHMLTEKGKGLAHEMGCRFSVLLDWLEQEACGTDAELTRAKRKLEEACFYAKKSMAKRHSYAEGMEKMVDEQARNTGDS